MKKIIVFMIALLILLTGFATPSYALSDSQSDSIQALLDDASLISGVPGMSISILADNEVLYF
ncbi:serine hydrolase, partial [Paenibacillus chitinolyticus]|nr:serine hydrolase [Paenibacillus chitinolyticus]